MTMQTEFPRSLCDKHEALDILATICRRNPTASVNRILREIADEEMAAISDFKPTCPMCSFQQAERRLGATLPADIDHYEERRVGFWDTREAMVKAWKVAQS